MAQTTHHSCYVMVHSVCGCCEYGCLNCYSDGKGMKFHSKPVWMAFWAAGEKMISDSTTENANYKKVISVLLWLSIHVGCEWQNVFANHSSTTCLLVKKMTGGNAVKFTFTHFPLILLKIFSPVYEEMCKNGLHGHLKDILRIYSLGRKYRENKHGNKNI